MFQRIRFYTQADSIDLFYISFIAGSSIDAEGVKALDIYLSAIQAEQVTTGWFVIVNNNINIEKLKCSISIRYILLKKKFVEI